VICLEARQVSAALAAMRNKTDKNDARGIAQILRTGWYSRVHVKSDASMVNSLIPLLDARLMLYQTYLKLDNRCRAFWFNPKTIPVGRV